LHVPEFLGGSVHASADAAFVPAQVREGTALLG
jgi:hypothetical protein